MIFFKGPNKLYYTQFLKTGIILSLDVILSLFASILAMLLVAFLLPYFSFSNRIVIIWLCGSIISSFIAFRLSKTYRAIIRYSTLKELGKICLACLYKDIVLWLIMGTLSAMPIASPLLAGIVVIDFCFSVLALLVTRILMIAVYDKVMTNEKRINAVHRVLVYGTGDKAVSALFRLRNSPHYHIEGFITFGDKISGHRIAGMDVCYFQNPDDIISNANKYGISGILFPYVADARAEQDRLIEYCKEANLRTYIVPGIDEITEGASLSNYIRKIRIEDLLGREEIKISIKEIVENFSNKVIMVTGAAGSIGSELCRQLATFGVKQLILFDNAETPLHNIRLELEDKFPELNFNPVVGDVRSLPRLDFVFRKYKPQVVFHAAAYKHVPLMEENPCEAVWVNVCGSCQVADKCVEYGVEKMVMVSTDKAVNPTNIMGCTKRLAEIYVQSLGLAIERGEIKGHTIFVTTRFGNVLGSNGSVIPRFREQIEHGGPVTVTHPEINRFFMTIPEACRLVMEAATFSTGTQIFVFDMGTPMKIVTLAERMIQLAGLEAGKDIKIEFTGLRPGEKLYEEVLATKENTIPTNHERIFVAKAREYPYERASEVVKRLTKYATLVTIPQMVQLMKHTVPEFKSRNSEYEIYDK